MPSPEVREFLEHLEVPARVILRTIIDMFRERPMQIEVVIYWLVPPSVSFGSQVVPGSIEARFDVTFTNNTFHDSVIRDVTLIVYKHGLFGMRRAFITVLSDSTGLENLRVNTLSTVKRSAVRVHGYFTPRQWSGRGSLWVQFNMIGNRPGAIERKIANVSPPNSIWSCYA